jgi:hypothetical protein
MGDVSRRAVLGAGVGTLGLVAFGIAAPAANAAATTRARPVPLAPDKASPMSAPLRSDYAHSVGRVFTATRDGHVFRIKLSRIEDLVATTAKQRPHCFALIFAPTSKARLHDGIYVLRRPGLHTHKLFVSSVGAKGVMQAIINRSH